MENIQEAKTHLSRLVERAAAGEEIIIAKPLLLSASKDKPVLISALAAKSEVLLTLDKGDFGILLGTTVYGMRVSTPRDFLIGEGLG